MFSVLEGEIEVTFRGMKTIIRADETINISANAPHQFQNKSGQTGETAMPLLTGRTGRVFQGSRRSRRNAPPPLDEEAEAGFVAKVKALAANSAVSNKRPPTGTFWALATFRSTWPAAGWWPVVRPPNPHI
jgi:hypothetical protein